MFSDTLSTATQTASYMLLTLTMTYLGWAVYMTEQLRHLTWADQVLKHVAGMMVI